MCIGGLLMLRPLSGIAKLFVEMRYAPADHPSVTVVREGGEPVLSERCMLPGTLEVPKPPIGIRRVQMERREERFRHRRQSIAVLGCARTGRGLQRAKVPFQLVGDLRLRIGKGVSDGAAFEWVAGAGKPSPELQQCRPPFLTPVRLCCGNGIEDSRHLWQAWFHPRILGASRVTRPSDPAKRIDTRQRSGYKSRIAHPSLYVRVVTPYASRHTSMYKTELPFGL